MICYFSGTGNSLWTAWELGHKDPVVGIVCPLCGWDRPLAVREALEGTTLSTGSYIFLAVTSNHGNSKKDWGEKRPIYKTTGLV